MDHGIKQGRVNPVEGASAACCKPQELCDTCGSTGIIVMLMLQQRKGGMGWAPGKSFMCSVFPLGSEVPAGTLTDRPCLLMPLPSVNTHP